MNTSPFQVGDRVAIALCGTVTEVSRFCRRHSKLNECGPECEEHFVYTGCVRVKWDSKPHEIAHHLQLTFSDEPDDPVTTTSETQQQPLD